MTPALQLNQEETKKISDKSSMAYKALMKMLRELRDRTGFRFSIIGTNRSGDLFVIDIDE